MKQATNDRSSVGSVTAASVPPTTTWFGRMLTTALRQLAAAAHRPWLGPLAGAVAAALTFAMSVPYTSVLVVALWLAPQRRRALVLWSAAGGAAAAAVLLFGMRHLAWTPFDAAAPSLLLAAPVQDIRQWLSDYGVWALGAVAAAPLPQSPALLFAAGSDVNVLAAGVALFAGKVIKYSVVAWLVSIGSPLANRLVSRLVRVGGVQLPRQVSSDAVDEESARFTPQTVAACSARQSSDGTGASNMSIRPTTLTPDPSPASGRGE